MDCSTPGFPAHHQSPELAQTPSSCWCHPAISSYVVPFYSCLQSFPASGSFPVSQFFTWGGQSIAVSASASVISMNTQGLISFRMDWLNLLAVQGTHKSLLHRHSSKASVLRCSACFIVQLSHPYMTIGKTIAGSSPRLEAIYQSMVILFISNAAW